MVRSTLPPPERLQYHLSTEAKRGGPGVGLGVVGGLVHTRACHLLPPCALTKGVTSQASHRASRRRPSREIGSTDAYSAGSPCH